MNGLIEQWGYINNPNSYLATITLPISYSSTTSFSVVSSASSPVNDLTMEITSVIKTINTIRIGAYNDRRRDYPKTLFYFTKGY